METQQTNHRLPKIGSGKTHEKNVEIKQNQTPSYLLTGELVALFEKMADFYRWKNVILRGLINGIFTAIGATVGFALLFYIVTKVYSGLQDIAFVDAVMEATGLDQVVEYVIVQTNTPQVNNGEGTD